MSKQAFGQGKKLQKDVLLLYNFFSNRFDNLIDSLDDKNIINRYQKRNATRSWFPATRKNRVAGHSKVKKGAARRNRISIYSEKKPGIEDINGDLCNVKFFIKK